MAGMVSPNVISVFSLSGRRIVSAAGRHPQKRGYCQYTGQERAHEPQRCARPFSMNDFLKNHIMNNFTLNIQFSVSPESAELLREIFLPGDLPEHSCCSGIDSPEFETKVADICVGVIKQLSKHAKPEGNSGKAVEPAPEAPAAPAPAPAPENNSGSEEITDAQLREVVKAAKGRTDAKAVKAVFAEMGIANSTECPQERRSELVAKLENLK